MANATRAVPSQSGAILGVRERRQTVFGGLIGFVLGALFGQSVWGAASGSALGILIALVRALGTRVRALSEDLEQISGRLGAAEADATGAAEPATTPTQEPTESLAASPEAKPLQPFPAPRASVAGPSAAATSSTPSRSEPAEPGAIDRGIAAIRELLFGGNTVVRVGIGVLLVGVSMLAKWAADNAVFPIEARLAFAAAIGFALVIVGIRLRNKRPTFATTLQGGGIAALYLVVFSAQRIFELVPATVSFPLFVALAIAGGLLAVVQRDQALLFIASVGGFAAPVLASTGAGNHVFLFSYYLLLDTGIAVVALRRTWRAVNLLAFVSTYGVATVWGALRYSPEHFGTTEPFLLAFMLLFTAVALLYAWRQPPRLAGLVDGTLVFGTPLITLLLQARLVDGSTFALAYSAAGFGLYYAALAFFIVRRGPAALRALAEAFIALAIGFGTMAIPLALDSGLSTALVWAAEGAGLYWLGVRQDRRLARASGVLLQGLAAIAALLGAASSPDPGALPILNAGFLAFAALAVAGLFISRTGSTNDAAGPIELRLHPMLLAWGLAWWANAVVIEVETFVPWSHQAPALVVAIAITAIILERLDARLAWRQGGRAVIAAIPAAFLVLVNATTEVDILDFIAWPIGCAAIFWTLLRLEARGDRPAAEALAGAFWLVAAVLASGLLQVADRVAGLGGDWAISAFGCGLAVTALSLTRAIAWSGSAFERHAQRLVVVGGGPIAAAVALWSLVANTSAQGNASPLPYLPLLNPVDVALALSTVAVVVWWQRARAVSDFPIARTVAPAMMLGLAFVWLNGVIARSVHQFADVPFDAEALWRSAPLQVSLSIAWTVVALAGMWLSTRRGWRGPWMIGAALLGVVVAKLFVIDLSQLSTGAKIVTFLVVGGLLLVVGYLSPVPPAREDAVVPETEGGSEAAEEGA